MSKSALLWPRQVRGFLCLVTVHARAHTHHLRLGRGGNFARDRGRQGSADTLLTLISQNNYV